MFRPRGSPADVRSAPHRLPSVRNYVMDQNMHHIEHCQSMEAKFRQEAGVEPDEAMRERLLAQADSWHRLARASRFIADKQAETNKILTALDRPLALAVNRDAE